MVMFEAVMIYSLSLMFIWVYVGLVYSHFDNKVMNEKIGSLSVFQLPVAA